MYSAFQSNAVQSNAAQIVRSARTTDNGLLGGKAYSGKYHYVTPYSHYQEEQAELARKRAKAQAIEHELALAERRQQETQERLAEAEAMRQQKTIEELMVLEAGLQEEINRLRMERIWLVRLIDDEEAILVILISRTLH